MTNYETTYGIAKLAHLLAVLLDANLRRAVAIDPGSYEARLLLGVSWARRGECPAAVAPLGEAQRLRPFYPAPSALLMLCRRQVASPP